MKKFIAIVAFIAAMLMGIDANAQAKLPNDPAVKVGKLKNGLTYYVRANKKPANRAEFYIVTHAGAILETPDQDGLAHFLEHMCFNGTKNFPDKKLLEYCQSIGAEFGRNINASTGFEQTIYMLNNIPVNRSEVIDSSLLILHDYAHFVLAEQEEIDAERGVILEERRTRRNASWRTFEKSREVMWGPGTAYANHTLIGEEEQLKTFSRESLLRYYHTWYQPCNQAIIVVGDINEDDVIARIEKIFSDIPGGVIPAKPSVKALPCETPRVGVFTDPETASSSIEIGFFQDVIPGIAGTDVGLIFDVTKMITSIVMHERLTEISSKLNAPFINASIGCGNLCEETEVLEARASFKDGQWQAATAAVLTELEKMRRYGFDEEEVGRAKDQILAYARMMAQGADTRDNADFINDLVANFTQGEAYTAPQTFAQIAENLLPQITPEMVKNIVDRYITDPTTGRLTTKNIFIIYSAPEKEGLSHPTAEQLTALLDITCTSEIAQNAKQAIATNLMAGVKVKKSPVKKTEAGVYGTTVWTLKNGVKVYVLPTQYALDEVSITASAQGGKTLIEDDAIVNFGRDVYSVVRRQPGLSTFDNSTLNKMIAGKNVSANAFVGEYSHGVSAFSTPEDLETALQLLCLNYLAPRFEKEDFEVGINLLSNVLPNQLSNPMFELSRRYTEVYYNGNIRKAVITPELLEQVSFDVFKENYLRLFSNFAGGNVVIVGNVDLKTLKPLVEKYIGTLPTSGTPTAVIDRHETPVAGEIIAHREFPMETLKSSVIQISYAESEWSVAKEVAANAASLILDMVYVETLRESEGGTYGASSNVSIERRPKSHYELFTYFDTNNEQAASLEAMARAEVVRLAEQGPKDAHFAQAAEMLKKQISEKLIRNSYWKALIGDYIVFGTENFDKDWAEAVAALTPADVQAVFAEIVASGNFFEFELRGIEK